jgi:hypothetical protein
MNHLLILVAMGVGAAAASAPTEVLTASWEAGKVLASVELTPEVVKPIAAVLAKCSPIEVRFELELRQDRQYWPDSVVARTLIRNTMQCEPGSNRTVTRVVDGVVVAKDTKANLEDVLSFLTRTGQVGAFPGLTNSARRLFCSIKLNSTVLVDGRVVLSAPRLARIALAPGAE